MRGYNHVNLIGNLTANPVIKTIAGTKCATFFLAVSETYKVPGGEVRNNTTFIPIIGWGKMAEICEKHLSKGKRIHVAGKLRIKAVAGTDQKKWYTSILLKEFLFLDSKPSQARLTPGDAELSEIPSDVLEPEEFDDLSMLENSQYSE